MSAIRVFGRCALAVALCLTTETARAQGVRIVEAPGLGSLPDIQSAVDAAVDGDTLLVAPGSYAGFVIDGKQLFVLATVEGAVVVDGTVELRNVHGERLSLVAGLDVTGARVAPKSDPGVRVQDSDGHIRFQGCVIRGGRGTIGQFGAFGDGGQGGIVTNCSRVTFVECELRGGDGYGIDEGDESLVGADGGLGIRTSGSSMALYDCLAEGGKGGNAGINAGNGAIGCQILDIGVFASGCTFQGGAGGFAWDFISSFGGDGGDGLRVAASAQAQLVDNAYVGGAAGGVVVGVPGAPGAPTSGGGIFKYHAGQARTFSAGYLGFEGEAWQLDLKGEPGDWAFVASGVEPAWKVPFPKTGIWLVPMPVYFQWPPLAVLPPSGTATVQLPGAGVAGTLGIRAFLLQGWVVDPDDGYGRLGSPLHRVLLNREAPPDCDSSGVNDTVEILQGLLADCDGDLEADLCEVLAGTEPDCNSNLVPDGCDLSAGTSTDCDASGIPDECENLPDCNANLVPDVCDILNGTSQDLNGNGIPDECEVAGLTWYCDANAPPGGNGSLAAPFDRIDDALTVALSGDTIELLDGTFRGPGNQDLDFQGKELVLRGQNGPAACTIDFEGAPGISIVDGQTAATRVEGLTLTSAVRGVEVVNSSPVISRCVISDCYRSIGAGLFLSYSNARVEDCQLLRNSTYNGATPSGTGAGIYSSNGTPVIVRCLFEDNSSRGGGALAVGGPEATIVSHCVFRGNTADEGGAVCDASYSFGGPAPRLRLDDCLMLGNSAQRGGALFVDGIGFGTSFVSPVLTGCTLVDNTASIEGGALFVQEQCIATLANSVVWGNTAPNGAQIAVSFPEATLDVSYCDVQGGRASLSLTGGPTIVWGAGNLQLNPLFAAPALGNYRLGPGSPCIDAGANGLVPPDLPDIDGDEDLTEPVPLDLELTPRFVDDPLVPDTGSGTPPLIDMGAYEAD